MIKIAYFDCFSGVAGDMLLGALLDAGLSLDTLREGLDKLGFSGYRINTEKVQRSSIGATKFDVVIDETAAHPHRSLAHILGHIESSGLSDRVKWQAGGIFKRLGRVEAAIHGVPVEDVHFHEIGAVDSIVDIVGTAIGLEALGVEKCHASALPTGSGSVKTAHGRLPVPAPATLQLLAEAMWPLRSDAEPEQPAGELVTPTGAALVTGLAEHGRPPMNVTGVGCGAGCKDFAGWPNIVRVWLGETVEATVEGSLRLLETNIDDMNPQVYGYLMDRLFTAGALDVWFTPIQMKKNRPAVMLSVLADANREETVTDIVMRETSTLGVRVRTVDRHTAQREIIQVDTPLGEARAKVKRHGGEVLAVSPEYDDCKAIAEAKGLPFSEVRRVIEDAARQHLESGN